jgi:hypothetical protein
MLPEKHEDSTFNGVGLQHIIVQKVLANQVYHVHFSKNGHQREYKSA